MAYTIMVVDDSETIRSVLERTIRMTRLPVDRILEAPNGKEALRTLADEWVDIIFTDLNMPEMGGAELIDALKGDVELCDVPIVIVSTEGSQTRIEELRGKGIEGYLRKPFTPESIRDIIIDTLGEWDEQ
jgi:two-component system chemotaxis response regulator CheY